MHTLEAEQFAAGGAPRPPSAGVLLIDDHAILRAGVRALFEAERGFQVIGESGTVAEGLELSRHLQPDVVIMDLSFPEGGAIAAIGALRRECPAATVVVLTVHNTEECLCAAMRAGAHGFVAKDAAFQVLLNTIRSVMPWRQAQSLPSTGLRGDLAVRRHGAGTLGAEALKLTWRERQVLVGVAQGYTSKEIAAKLNRSVKTIVKHRSNMMRKLSLHDASSVTRFAIANGLLSP